MATRSSTTTRRWSWTESSRPSACSTAPLLTAKRALTCWPALTSTAPSSARSRQPPQHRSLSLSLSPSFSLSLFLSLSLSFLLSLSLSFCASLALSYSLSRSRSLSSSFYGAAANTHQYV